MPRHYSLDRTQNGMQQGPHSHRSPDQLHVVSGYVSTLQINSQHRSHSLLNISTPMSHTRELTPERETRSCKLEKSCTMRQTAETQRTKLGDKRPTLNIICADIAFLYIIYNAETWSKGTQVLCMKFAHISKHSSTTASATTGCYIKKKLHQDFNFCYASDKMLECNISALHRSKQSSYYVWLAHIHTMQTLSHVTDVHCFFTAKFGQTFEL